MKSRIELLKDKCCNFWDCRLQGFNPIVDIVGLSNQNDTKPSTEYLDMQISLLLSTVTAALTAYTGVGKATKSDLKSQKNKLDILSSFSFKEILQSYRKIDYVSTSESKDEKGIFVSNPIREYWGSTKNGFGLAVDVIDGTALTARGLPGAYSVSAIAKGLKAFPDLQAYALMAPAPIVEQFDFFSPPESIVASLVRSLMSSYNKQAHELTIVTHSYDTGTQHQTLIALLKAAGVHVIVPDPVIIEVPYTVGRAIMRSNAVDAMIGVFGLPEIVMNTLLLGILNSEVSIKFRLASNSMLKYPSDVSLERAFDFTESELREIDDDGLAINNIYSADNISKNLEGACFVASAITSDPILKMDGIFNSEKKYERQVESIYCSFPGELYKIKMTSSFFNEIKYTSRYELDIVDFSLVSFLNDAIFNSFYHHLKNELPEMADISFICENDFHVTLFEFCEHYEGIPGPLLAQNKEYLVSFFSELEEDMFSELTVTYDSVLLTENAILIKVYLNQENLLSKLNNVFSPLSSAFYNKLSVPQYLHITLCYFNSIMDKGCAEHVYQIVKKIAFDKIPQDYHFSLKSPELIFINSTPFSYERIWPRTSNGNYTRI